MVAILCRCAERQALSAPHPGVSLGILYGNFTVFPDKNCKCCTGGNSIQSSLYIKCNPSQTLTFFSGTPETLAIIHFKV